MELAIGSFDATIVVVYLATTIIFGVWLGRNTNSPDDYLLGGRSLPWWALLGSLVATETSTATFLSVPGIAYESPGDFRFLQLALGYIVGRVLVAFVLMPGFFKGRISSAYQILEDQFGIATRKIASLVFLITRNLGDGLRLYLTAIALEKTVGLPLPVCIAVIGTVTIIYTVFGGMKSVVWNDCIQFVIYLVGGLVALIAIFKFLPSGMTTFSDFVADHGGIQLFGKKDIHSTLTDPYSLYAGIVGGMVLTLGTHGTDQMMVQRYLSARSKLDASKAVVASSIVVFLQFALFLLLGAALACFYQSFPPEIAFEKGDSVFATFIVNQLPIGVVGFTLAAVFSAAMSTLSSSLNASAAALVSDFFLHGDQPIPDERVVQFSRIATVFFGLIQIGIGIAAVTFSRSVINDALAIAGFSAGVLLGVFLLGLALKHIDDHAGVIGMISGLSLLLFVKFGPLFVDGMIQIAWPWFALIGASVTFLAGWICNSFSLATTQHD